MEAYGWPIVSVFVIIVGLGMAEIASKYPTAGGLYYWASKMGGPAWGWFTGWFNLIGQIAITAGIDYGAATFTDALLQLLWPGSFHGTQHEIVAVYAVILALHAIMNIFSVKLVALLNDISVWWHVAGVLIIVGFLIFKPDHHQSFGYVFGHTINNSGFGHSWLWFVLLLGLLAGAVHVHRLRRVGAHERGDARCLPLRGARRRSGRSSSRRSSATSSRSA